MYSSCTGNWPWKDKKTRKSTKSGTGSKTSHQGSLNSFDFQNQWKQTAGKTSLKSEHPDLIKMYQYQPWKSKINVDKNPKMIIGMHYTAESLSCWPSKQFTSGVSQDKIQVCFQLIIYEINVRYLENVCLQSHTASWPTLFPLLPPKPLCFARGCLAQSFPS